MRGARAHRIIKHCDQRPQRSQRHAAHTRNESSFSGAESGLNAMRCVGPTDEMQGSLPPTHRRIHQRRDVLKRTRSVKEEDGREGGGGHLASTVTLQRLC
eukprot:308587-Rhodomonas_salina.2